MAKIRVTKEFHFEMAHALWNYDGPCRNIHGHSYKLQVTVIGVPEKDPEAIKQGMVIDFGILKNIVKKTVVDRFDHSVVVNSQAPHEFLKQVEQMFDRVEILPYQPTCENLVTDFAGRIREKLPDGVLLHHITLQETESSWASWYAGDNGLLKTE